jgi:L-threonylcarbamoyladenylate synthase
MEIKIEDLINLKLKDEIIVFETDTVYGIGCLLNSESGVSKIYEIKRRDNRNPLAVLCADIEQVKSLVSCDFSYLKVGTENWPGALTLVLPKTEIVGDFLTSGFDTVGVRIPDDKIAIQILKTFGPMAVTSLNLSTEPAILKYEDTLSYLDKVDYIVKGKNLSSISSTVYDPINDKVFRQGEIVIK